jgi:dephospho-CoA kinase
MKILSKKNRLYQFDVPVIGITGGISSGKSTFCHFLLDHECFVVSADQLVKNIYQKKSSLDFIINEFPSCIHDGTIQFKKLRELVFSNKAIKQKIEQFIYPQMEEAFREELKKKSKDQVIFYDVPLLYERNLQSLVDISVVVWINQKEQMKRLMERDKINPILASKILKNQLPLSKKREQADYVVDNSGSLEDLEAEFLAFISWLRTVLKDEYRLSKSEIIASSKA